MGFIGTPQVDWREELKAKFGRFFRRPRVGSSTAVRARPVARRRPAWARALLWTGGIFAGVIAVCLVILATLDWNALRGPVARYLSGRLHREVRIDGDLS